MLADSSDLDESLILIVSGSGCLPDIFCSRTPSDIVEYSKPSRRRCHSIRRASYTRSAASAAHLRWLWESRFWWCQICDVGHRRL